MPHFFLKLNACRPTFILDMSEAERAIMQRHADYWRALLAQGQVIVFGPVMDPAGPFGIGIVEAADTAAIEALIAADPAATLNRYEFHPMQAVLPPAA